MAPSPHPEDPPPEDPTYCRVCELSFDTWEQYHKHKYNVEKHRGKFCHVCSLDFRAKEACTAHGKQYHFQEQSLDCPTCNRHFTRLGLFIHHIDSIECNEAYKSVSRLRYKDSFYDEYDELSNASRQSEYEQIPGDFSFNNPMAQAKVANEDTDSTPRAIVSTVPQLLTTLHFHGNRATNSIPLCKPVHFENDDLISFDETPQILGTLSSLSDRQSVSFRNSPSSFDSVLAPSTDCLQVVPLALDKKRGELAVLNKFDPDNPDFKVKKCYNGDLKRYKCPWQGCKKSFESQNSILVHLRSAAHAKEKLKCNHCFKSFATPTALSQHSKTAAANCTVRQNDNLTLTMDKNLDDYSATSWEGIKHTR